MPQSEIPPGEQLAQKNTSAWVLVGGAAAVILVTLALLLTQGADAEETCINALKEVMHSAAEKNPDIVARLDSDPAAIREQVHRIALSQPDIQTLFNSHGLWERREEFFAKAWQEFVRELSGG